ncbi:MAG: hypothetical protein ACRD2B_14030 [Terriglobia bacterium]
MSPDRRKNWTRTAIKIIVPLIVLDALAYVALQRPLARLLSGEEQRFTVTRLEWQREKQQLVDLQKRDEQLPAEDRQLAAFLRRHVPPRREGYSRAALLIDHLTEQSGVGLAGISYGLAQTKGDPFEHLGLKVEVQGPFGALLSFGHALESASDFIVVRSFKFEAAGGGVLGLQLNADLYLMP